MSTARDRVETQRAAFVAGIRATSSGRWTFAKQHAAESLAAGEYPTPTYERPRVVRVGESDYKIENGQLFVRWVDVPHHYVKHREWRRLDRTREEYQMLVDLFDRPTETVEGP